MTDLKIFKSEKPLHHPEALLTKHLEKSLKQNFNVQKALLLKYFPKYYKNLIVNISAKDQSFISKLKQTKTIDHFTAETSGYYPGNNHSKTTNELEQILFRNKRKSMKSLPLLRDSSQFIMAEPKMPQLSTFFPRMISLDLWRAPQFTQNKVEFTFISRDMEREILHSYGYFWMNLRHLKHLKISNNHRYFWLIINKVDSSHRFLSKLKTLELSLSFFYDRKDYAYPRNVLKDISQNENFLRHLTHLNCQGFDGFQYYDELINQLLTECPNLISFEFPLGRESRNYSSPDENFQECRDIRVLERLETINNLQRLSVSVFGIKTFLNHFTPPPYGSLQRVILNIRHSFYDLDLLDLFQKKEARRFFGCWEKLQHLSSLKISMRRIRESNDLVKKFVVPLLEAIPNLKKFRLKLASSPTVNWREAEALDLSLLLDNVAAMKNIKSLKILNSSMDDYSSYETQHHLIKFDPKRCILLKNLTKVDIESEVCEEFDFKSFIKLFSGETRQKKKSLKLSTLSFISIESFSECIKVINSWGNSELKMTINLAVDSFKALFDYFNRAPIVLEKNVEVKLRVYLMSPSGSVRIKSLTEEEKRDFARVFGGFNLTVAQTIYRSYFHNVLL